ncbi:MAG: hypothetical protein HOE80_04045 [Candidatus Magasanikbacteria bacterium]|nr:hypothetical protein [Candidatus Magasanikbacteria bacterium]
MIFLLVKKKEKVYKNKVLFVLIILALITTVSFLYARFIEPQIILIKNTQIETGFSAKFVVISDIHLGVYKGTHFLERIVEKINTIEQVDAVLIPGDFIYYPQEDLEVLFSSLKQIKFPVYAVLGNHDTEESRQYIDEELQKALEENGVIFLSNSSAYIEQKNIRILGLGDKWTDEDDISKIDKFTIEDNVVVITHNPDTTLEYTNSIPDLTVSGHTHGGQIRIPYLYKKVIPCVGDFDAGLYDVGENNVFVTAGVGEIGLPMRLGIPPTIEILELY